MQTRRFRWIWQLRAFLLVDPSPTIRLETGQPLGYIEQRFGRSLRSSAPVAGSHVLSYRNRNVCRGGTFENELSVFVQRSVIFRVRSEIIDLMRIRDEIE